MRMHAITINIAGQNVRMLQVPSGQIADIMSVSTSKNSIDEHVPVGRSGVRFVLELARRLLTTRTIDIGIDELYPIHLIAILDNGAHAFAWAPFCSLP